MCAWFFGRSIINIGLGITMDHIDNIQISDNVLINDRCKFLGKGRIFIDQNTYIATDVTFLTTTHSINDMTEVDKDIIIGSFVWIGCGAVLLPGVVVGEGSIIGAGSIVTKNVDRYSVWCGNPARKIKDREKIRPYRLPGGGWLK